MKFLWIEYYKCGCSTEARRKKDLLGYCNIHGDSRKQLIKLQEEIRENVPDEPSLGPCCYCGTTEKVYNIIMVDKKSPIPGHGWGCFTCDLPFDGASYVLCDDCLNSKVEPKFACRGYPATEGRIAFDELRGIHQHDMSRHVFDQICRSTGIPDITN